jgi:hypothetical protein
MSDFLLTGPARTYTGEIFHRGTVHGEDHKRCDIGPDQRCRDLDGQIRHKRGDTSVKTLRKTYGPDFAPGLRGDMRLDTLRERASGSLTKIVKKR